MLVILQTVWVHGKFFTWLCLYSSSRALPSPSYLTQNVLIQALDPNQVWITKIGVETIHETASLNWRKPVLSTCDYLREIETIGENTNRGFRFLLELLKKGKGEKNLVTLSLDCLPLRCDHQLCSVPIWFSFYGLVKARLLPGLTLASL